MLRVVVAMFVAYLAVLVVMIRAQTCSAGLPAFITCDTATSTCTADTSLICETIDGVLYCCPPVETTTPTTTSTTPTTTTYVCRDNATYCTSQKALCTNAIYKETMNSQCRVTCGACPASAVTGGNVATTMSGCADAYTTCASNSGLCKNANYSYLMPIYCKKTCGLC